MPIRPENRHRYPPNWKTEIVPRIRERSGNRCECRGECGWKRCLTRIPGWGRCNASNGQPHPVTGSKVVLTTAHTNHTPEDCRDEVLLHLCQGCHLALDGDHHAANRAATLEAQRRAAEEERRRQASTLEALNGMEPLFDLTLGGEGS